MNDQVEIVRNDIRCHRENGVSLNPFSTRGARDSWQKGFDGIPSRIGDHLECYSRGVLTRMLLEDEESARFPMATLP